MNAGLVHAAIFSLGAALGVGVASAVVDRRKSITVVPSQPTVVVETPASGNALALPTREVAKEVLRYGYPG